MKIIVGKLSGFCNGVAYTVTKANEILDNNENVYCLGQIVHNERVIKSLEDKNMITINSIDEALNKSKVIIRAHGELKETYDKANDKDIEIFDLTCGKIKAIRNKIDKEKEKSFIVIIGKKSHPETLGVKSFAEENSYILESVEDIDELEKRLNKESIYVVSQTTFNSEKFDKLVGLIKEKINVPIKVDKTICDATSNRQKETEELSKKVDCMIIVGGKNSSNTKELEIVSKNNCNRVHLIQDVEDLKELEFIGKEKIGIMAGASTPQIVVDEIIEYLNSLK